MGGKVNLATAPQRKGSRYPESFQARNSGKHRYRLGDAQGLSQFGVNLLTLPPGQWSSERHWHSDEDEFVYVLKGEAVLVTDRGQEVLKAGDCACFPAGEAVGHHLQNRSDADVVLLEVGARKPGSGVTYTDSDLAIRADGQGYAHKDGRPY